MPHRLMINCFFVVVRERGRTLLVVAAIILTFVTILPANVQAEGLARQVLAMYYGWYGNPDVSGHWRHWRNVDTAHGRIENTAHFPTYGAYDSHDPAIIDQQVETAHAVGITGFVASWWGRGSFEDRSIPLLLAAARKHGLVVSAYYETIAGNDTASRVMAAVTDLDYLLAQYGADKAWLHVGAKPVLFIYGRALHQLTLADWQVVIERVRHDNPNGVLFIPDSIGADWVSSFDGMSTYNITQFTKGRSASGIRAWARITYPNWVARGARKISTLIIIPGYDDRNTGRPAPRPITERWNGETYAALWSEAITAAPDYVLITSWNEWHEGSEIEPSLEYGSLFINKTATFAKQFLAGNH